MKFRKPDSPADNDAIEAIAASWLTEREEGFTPAQARDFERWSQAHPRHAAAVARLEKTCTLLRQLPRVRDQLESADESAPNAGVADSGTIRFHPWRWLGAAAAAAAVVAAAGWWQWPAKTPTAQHYATSAGGYERVTLADGSVLELNANSEAHVRYSDHERSVALTAGEAHFSVAHETKRPFVVRAGAVLVRAVGTAFNVRLASASVEVLVTEGKVTVSPKLEPMSPAQALPFSSAPASGIPSLHAGERAVFSRGAAELAPPIEKVEPIAIRQALAWQERMLLFVDTPLRDVAAQFNLRNRIQLVIGDPALAGRPVGGTFAAENVETFVRLLEKSGDIVAERRGEWEIVLRKTR